jgi:hypothetical protein
METPRRFSRSLVVLGAAILLLLITVGMALAQDRPVVPPGSEPTGGAHPHHVMTGNGCRDINAVLFLPDTRGLHQGSNQSGAALGPSHGPCPTPTPT